MLDIDIIVARLWPKTQTFGFYTGIGVSIIASYGEKPPDVKFPIFSEFIENSVKFMNNSGTTAWKSLKLNPIQRPIDEQSVNKNNHLGQTTLTNTKTNNSAKWQHFR